MTKNIFILLLTSLLIQSCSFLRTTSISSIPKNRTNPVQASVSRLVFLAFNFDNDYIAALPKKLARTCPNGFIRGILTKHETVSYIFFVKHIVTAKGFCTTK